MSGFGIGGTVVLFLDSGVVSRIPLSRLDCAAVCKSAGDVGERGRPGRTGPVEVDCLERLPDEVAERRLGVDVVPMEVKLAKALDVLSLAKEASERLLLLVARLVELLWWCCGVREATRLGEFEVEERYWEGSDRLD